MIPKKHWNNIHTMHMYQPKYVYFVQNRLLHHHCSLEDLHGPQREVYVSHSNETECSLEYFPLYWFLRNLFLSVLKYQLSGHLDTACSSVVSITSLF